MSAMQRISAVVLRQFYLARSSPTRLVPTFAWAGIDILIWGFMTRWLDTLAGQQVAFVPSLLGAVLLWNFFGRVMQGVTVALFEDVWSRNFLNLFATPIGPAEYLAGLVITSLLLSGIGLSVMILMASGIFGWSAGAYGLYFLPFLLVLLLFGIALGLFANALVLRLGPASEWLIWPIPAVLSPFAGVFYPITTLPGWMQGVALLLPPAQVFEGLRAISAGQPWPLSAFLIALALCLLYVALGFVCFRWVYRGAVRSGLLARYSAESVA
jgi:ABC-2 type transport system permease protein